ncbi:MAG: rhomboid family intramembrane serine protease [Candidatus Saccharicenans sp.]|nr:rhomboid family intramembrane serine protease [Candidatus Saccharicenans sp.]MDH7492708.1 rhomboid family intramembrane serine protease [Candidatus Saccharicenans sp.]
MPHWRQDKLWRQQKRFIISSAVIGFFLPLLIALFFELIITTFGIWRYFVLPSIFLFFVVIKSVETGQGFWSTLRDYCTFVPVDYVEKESLLEKNFNATYALILANVFIHYGIELFGPQARESISSYFACLPSQFHWWNAILSPLTSMFIHADSEHLWGNMVFLWIFGLVLERRIGWKKFLTIYFLTGLVSSIVPPYLSIVLLQKWWSGIGASGAISGLMGAFAFRLFYKRMVFPIPLLGILSYLFGLNLKVRMNSLMVIMSYFFYNFLGSLFQLSGEDLGIAYLSHLSGMLFGMYLGSRMKFQDEAKEEMMLERAQAAIDEKGHNQQTERLFELLLEKNPHRVEALVFLAQLKNRFGPVEEGKILYLRAIDLLIDKEPETAAEIFAEYFGHYRQPLEAAKQYKLTDALEKIGKVSLAARALEMLADEPNTPEAWRSRILYRAARILKRLEFYEAACYRYQQLLEEYPDFKEAQKVKFRLERLKQAREEHTWTAFIQKKKGALGKIG